MSSLQDLAAEYGVDGFEYDHNELADEHAMEWWNEDLHGSLDNFVDEPSLHPSTRSRRTLCSIELETRIYSFGDFSNL